MINQPTLAAYRRTICCMMILRKQIRRKADGREYTSRSELERLHEISAIIKQLAEVV